MLSDKTQTARFPMTSFKLTIPHRFRKSPPVQISSARTALLRQQAGSPSRQYMAWGGPSTRLVSADNTRCDGHQHICRKGRSTPVAIIYGITLRLPCTANVHQAALIFIGTRSLQMYNAGSCRILSASVLFSVYAFNEKNYSSPIRKRDGMRPLCQSTSCTSCISLMFIMLSTMNLTSFRS